MKVTIGIRGGARELHLEINQTEDELAHLVTTSQQDGSVLQLTSSKGHQVMVPAAALGYVLIDTEEPHQVGFNLG